MLTFSQVKRPEIPGSKEDSASKEQVGIEEDALYPSLDSAYVSGLTHMHILKQTYVLSINVYSCLSRKEI